MKFYMVVNDPCNLIAEIKKREKENKKEKFLNVDNGKQPGFYRSKNILSKDKLPADSDDSMQTDSDFEENMIYDQYRELIFKAKFTDIDDIDNLLASFCKRWRIRKSDELSLTNYVIVTIETEKIAHDSRQIISSIEDSFIVDELLQKVNKKFKPKDSGKNKEEISRQKIISAYNELL